MLRWTDNRGHKFVPFISRSPESRISTKFRDRLGVQNIGYAPDVGRLKGFFIYPEADARPRWQRNRLIENGLAA